MDTVTYPDDTVAAEVSKHFATLKLNLLERHPDFREATGGARVPWAPAMIFTDSRGRELRRYVGWLSPRAFRAELRLVRALHEIGQGRFAEALPPLEEVGEDFSDTDLVPEALYWHGIAGFLAGERDMGALEKSWRRLAQEYPGTRWGMHASVIEDC